MKLMSKSNLLVFSCLSILISAVCIFVFIFLKYQKRAFLQQQISGSVTLQLNDSTVMNLDSIGNGKYITQAERIIARKGENGLEFQRTDISSSNSNLFTLTVPFGRKYHLRLTDGTNVVMRVGSKLRFPDNFDDHERRVELNGCAYFEVAHGDRRPFIIKSRRLLNKVWASCGAVEDYVDDSSANIYVDSGVFNAIRPEATIQILSGQSAVVKHDSLTCQTADIYTKLFWKNQYFEFDGLDTKHGVTKIAEAYRMKILFGGNVRSGPFGSGKIQMDLPLQRLLKDLELKDLNFGVRMQDSTILVKGQ